MLICNPLKVVFQYGSVVFFNTSEAVQKEVLQKLAARDTAKLKDGQRNEAGHIKAESRRTQSSAQHGLIALLSLLLSV